MLSHGFVISTPGSHWSTSPSSSPLPSATTEFRISILSFYLWCFSLAGCLFSSQAKSCISTLPFLSKFVLKVALLFGPVWLPWLLPHMSGSQTVPWPLVLRLLVSAELLFYLTSLLRLIISRTIWSEWTRSRWSPWPDAGCSLGA
jgi:hypothetical protein